MKTVIALLCVLFAVVANAHAGAIVIVSQHEVTAEGVRTISGSGAIIRVKGKTCVLSCGHGWRESSLLTVDGKLQGRIVRIDKKLDLSLIEVDCGDDCEAYSLAEDEPPIGAVVWSGGFVQSKPRGHWRKVREYNLDHLKLDLPHEHGQSGGPVIFEGRIVGVVQGAYVCNGATCARGATIRLREVRRFIEGVK